MPRLEDLAPFEKLKLALNGYENARDKQERMDLVREALQNMEAMAASIRGVSRIGAGTYEVVLHMDKAPDITKRYLLVLREHVPPVITPRNRARPPTQ